MSTGQIIGGVIGAAAGSYFGGNTSTGYALGSAAGGLVDSSIQQKKAGEMDILTQTPAQTALLEEMRMKRRAMEAGTYYQPQQEQIKQMGTGALRAATRVAGGDAGSTISAMSKIHRGTGRTLDQLYGTMMQKSLQMLPMEAQMLEGIAQREHKVSEWEKLQPMYDAMQKSKDAQQIIAGVLAARASKAGITDPNELEEYIAKELAKRPSYISPMAGTNYNIPHGQYSTPMAGTNYNIPQGQYSTPIAGTDYGIPQGQYSIP